jgi:hypothetical protein
MRFRIRDPECFCPGTGMGTFRSRDRDNHPGSATLVANDYTTVTSVSFFTGIEFMKLGQHMSLHPFHFHYQNIPDQNC